MLKDILQGWDQKERKPFLARLKGRMLGSRPLRERIIFCIYRLTVEKDKLEVVILKLKRRDNELKDKCNSAQAAKDEARVSIYATEGHEIGKIFKIIYHCKLTIEQVILRLETIGLFADIAASITVPITLIRDVRHRLSGFMPSASARIGEVASELEDIIVVAGKVESTTDQASMMTDEAKRILAEAQVVVEARSKDVFPEIQDELEREAEPI